MKKYRSPHVVVDIEANGGIIGKHSMVSFGACIVEPNPRTFYYELCPISDEYVQGALDVCKFTHEQTKTFPQPEEAIHEFVKWLDAEFDGRPILWSDNNGFDASWINWYMLVYNNNTNPFGHSSRRIGDFICGLERNLRYQWKKLRKFKHTHNGLDDAIGNASAMLQLQDIYGVQF